MCNTFGAEIAVPDDEKCEEVRADPVRRQPLLFGGLVAPV
jgi:hypothetical protein